MKKFLCLFLSVIMLVSLCGCFGGSDTDNVRGEISNDGTSQDSNEPAFSLGKATGSTYNNDFLGISCTFPEGWEFYSDEQIKQLNNVVGDYLDEDVAKQLENAPIVYDMFAQYQTEGSSVNINLEKLNAVQLISLNIKQTLEAQVDAIKSSYENIGYSDIKIEYQKITVDGKEFDGLNISAKIQGVDFFTVVFAFRKSNYLANITVSSLQTNKINDILGCFTVK